MSTAPRYLPRYTVADYQLWDGDWELWDGVAVAMSPSPFGRHQVTAKNVCFALETAVRSNRCPAVVLYEIDWIIGRDTVVRPDIVVVCGDAPDRHVESPPAIVVEVLSDATRLRDTTFKRDLYREQGVANYVIVDPEAESITVDMRDAAGKISTIEVVDAVKLVCCNDCEVELRRSHVFRS